MKVWIVTRNESYSEGDHYRQDFEIIGVYDSEEKAEAEVERLNAENEYELNDYFEALVYSYQIHDVK